MMKKLLGCLLFAAALFVGCTQSQKGGRSDLFEQEKFRNPENGYRAVPFYSLNDNLDSAELVRQLGLMKEGGYGGSFLHSRIGLLTPYLSEEWFHMMDVGVEASQKLGIDAWFYDEDKWPSGFAGGIVPLQNPDFQARMLVRMPKDYVAKAPDSILLRDDLYAYVCHVDPLGNPWYNGTSWVDLMNPDMVQAFIDCSYKPYVDRYGGKPHVLGMFSDEPQISALPKIPNHLGTVSYSPVMEKVFKEKWGYDLHSVLPSLFDTVGDWRTVRLHYYRTVAYCMEQAFSKPIGDYCAANNFIWTGHYNGEDIPTSTMLNEGNLMQQLRHMQQPGFDALWLKYRTVYCAKGVTSVANQYGLERRLSELFGISGHNLSFEDRMWITSWHTIMGVNFMCPHLYLYSMKGARKRDFPPTISHQQPYWEHNKLFEDYSARLCYFATVGQTDAEVCIIHPLESAYIEYDQHAQVKFQRDDAFEEVLVELMESHRNSDLGDEQIISEIAKVQDGRFVVGSMAYRVVVLPELLTIRPETLTLLKQFAEQGGTVLVYGSYPQMVEGAKNDAAIEELKKYSTLVQKENFAQTLNEKSTPEFTLGGAKATQVWTHLRKLSNGASLQLSNTSRMETLQVSLKFTAPNTEAALWNPINGECLKFTADANGDYTLEFAPAQTWIVTTGGAASGVKYDADYTLSAAKQELFALNNTWIGKRTAPNAITLDFAAFSKDGGKTWGAPEPVLAFSDRTIPQPYNGPLSLKYSFQVEELPSTCLLAMEQPKMYTSIVVNGKEVAFEGKDSYIDASIRTQEIASFLQKGNNEVILTLNYISPIPTSLSAVERYGTEIESIYLAGDFAVYGKKSDKPLTEIWRNRNKQLKPAPIVQSFQSFRLGKEQSEFTGDLTTQGYPFYCGSFQLSNTFDLTEVAAGTHYVLSFPGFEAILVGVNVNGTDFPVLFASPWEVDVTSALKAGKNEVRLTLTNSLRNLMGPHHNKGGEFSGVGPSVFRGGNDWPNMEMGDADWYDARLRGNPILWRDDYYVIPFGMLQPPVLSTLKK